MLLDIACGIAVMVCAVVAMAVVVGVPAFRIIEGVMPELNFEDICLCVLNGLIFSSVGALFVILVFPVAASVGSFVRN